MHRNIGFKALAAACLLTFGGAAFAANYTLKATPQTVHLGHYDARVAPVLTIKSGDTVDLENAWGLPEALKAEGVPESDEVLQELIEIAKTVKDKGPAPHILTGPIYVEGAEPGDVLEVHIKDVRLRTSWGWNSIIYPLGVLPDDFPIEKFTLIPLDREAMVAKILPGIEVPLRPYFGSMGVSPLPTMGRISAGPPGIHGGNMDNKELVAGSILYLPVHVKGALFSAGDGHAAQGDGEVDLTAIETSLAGTFQFFVRKGERLKVPRAETPTHYILMGLDPDLNKAAEKATREAVNFLVKEKGLDPVDAYMLTSAAVDLHVTQLVDGTKGVHAMVPKSIFKD